MTQNDLSKGQERIQYVWKEYSHGDIMVTYNMEKLEEKKIRFKAQRDKIRDLKLVASKSIEGRKIGKK